MCIEYKDVFIEKSKMKRGRVKYLILKNELIEYKCIKCGIIDEWQGYPIVLDLDHINGINNDNRIDNLRFLCPNCHSQTPTYKGRNPKKRNNNGYVYTDVEFIEAVNTSYNINQVCEKLDLSAGGNYETIKKRMSKLDLQFKTIIFKKDITNRCIDCDVEIYRNSTRCVICVKIKQRKVNRPTLQQLEDDLEEMSYVNVGKKYGVSDNSIRKWIKKYKENEK